MKTRRLPFAGWVLLLLTALLTGCTSAPAYPKVSLAEGPASPASARASPSAALAPPLRVAIAAVTSPKNTVRSYSPLLDYLAQRIGRQVQLVQGRTYHEVNNLVRDGNVDLALVCSGAYVQGHDDFGMELLVAPQVGGETIYYSFIIVPASSPVRSLTELRGKAFAFTDPMSNSGWLMPVYMLRQMGESAEKFFGRTIYTYSHDNSIRAVSDGLVDGAAVDSLVYEYALRQDPSLTARLRVIVRSGANAIPPVVVRPTLDPGQKSILKELFLTMHESPDGRAALAPLMIDRFVGISDSAYESVRSALREVREAK